MPFGIFPYGSASLIYAPAISICVYASLFSRKFERNAHHIELPAKTVLSRFLKSAISDFVFSMK
jgi:hypothetical protein